MIKLKEVTLNKFKVFTTTQTVKIEDDITAIVGLNESGKTAFLEALAKLNYFDEDPNFQFNPLTDFPRSELKSYEGQIDDIEVLLCKFEVTAETLINIENDIGPKTLISNEFYYGARYNNWQVWRDFEVDVKQFLHYKLEKIEEDGEVSKFINSVNLFEEIPNQAEVLTNPKISKFVMDLYNYVSANSYDWEDNLKGYIAKRWFKPNLPKFWYFDEYYSLPSRINLRYLLDEKDKTESNRTALALFKLAKINIEDILQTDNFEQFVAELENTANIVTNKIYQYWSTNKNLELEFEIEIEHHTKESGRFFKSTEEFDERFLNIRIRDKYDRVSLPLERRSRGFNWFFSFIVWFSQIENELENYILLLDEPGLSLHAIAQTDLLNFLENLSEKYQVVFSTHSPFMLKTSILDSIRTVTPMEKGSEISDIYNEKDPDTLFPTQVAVGYELSKNLLVHKKNLLVKDVSDLILLKAFSDFLNSQNNSGLNKAIAITPVGGLENIIKFITLMSGYSLDMKFLSESTTCRNDGEIEGFGGEFLNFVSMKKIVGVKKGATLFDLFEKNDFIKLAEGQLKVDNKIEHPFMKNIEIDNQTVYELITNIIKKSITKRRFNQETFNNFELLFREINKQFNIKL